MLLPHNPSQNLHPAAKVYRINPEDLADIDVTEIESVGEDPVGQPVVNGRTARFNVTMPPKSST